MADKLWVGTDTAGDWSVAANWSPAGVPVNADDVYMRDSSQSVTTGFDQSAVTLDSLNIDQSYTGEIGDSDDYLKISATVVRIGYHYGPGTPAGSGLIKLDFGNNQATVTIHDTGSPSDTDMPAVQLLNVHANSTIEVRKGSVGLAVGFGEVSTVSKITTSYVSQKASDADMFIGSGVTLTTLDQTGGDCVLECAATTVTSEGGNLETAGSGAITTLNIEGGDVTSNSTGTITNLNVSVDGGGGSIDFTKSAAARTVTTPILEAGGTIKRDPGVVTFTNEVASNDPVTLRAAAA